MNKRTFKLVRNELHESQTEFSERLGISKSYTEKIEMGLRAITSNIERRIEERCNLSKQRLTELIGVST